MEALFPLIITFGLMWVLLIRPQQRRVRQHQNVVATLEEGDEVVTTGGVIGTVAEINEDVLTLAVAPGVSIRVLRSAVQNRIGGLDEIDPDEPDDPDDFDEEPDLPEIETATVDELPPAAAGELPGPSPEPAADAVPDRPPLRPDSGNGA
jgi:preprotein translocase subunit YajC